MNSEFQARERAESASSGNPAGETAARRRVGFWILIGLLAVSGVVMAFTVIFRLTESRAFDITWLIFVADVYLIASLAAKHRWLRLAIWAGTAVSFVYGLVLVFWPDQSYYVELPTTDSGDASFGWERSPYGVMSDLNISLHIVIVTLLLLGFLSLGYRRVSRERILRGIYVFAYAAGLVAALLWAILTATDSEADLTMPALGVSILALTAAAIVIIAALVQRRDVPAGVPGAAVPGSAAPGSAAPGSAVPGSAVSATAERAVVDQTGIAGFDPEQLRALVRGYVEEYLAERESSTERENTAEGENTDETRNGETSKWRRTIIDPRDTTRTR
ncbi:MAG: hypothetical protein ACK5LO_09560 [Leucobacter sp.]